MQHIHERMNGSTDTHTSAGSWHAQRRTRGRLGRVCAALLVAGLASLSMSGCNTVSISSTEYLGVPTYPPTNAATVQIVHDAPNVPNVKLGELTVEPQGSPSTQEIEVKIQEAAAKMGGNAVVIVADRTMLTGAAVSGPGWDRTVSPEMGRVIIGIVIRFVTP